MDKKKTILTGVVIMNRNYVKDRRQNQSLSDFIWFSLDRPVLGANQTRRIRMPAKPWQHNYKRSLQKTMR
jgi:hypothetical protein